MAESRRQFLKNVGKGLAGLAGSTVLSGCSNRKRVYKKGEYEGNHVEVREVYVDGLRTSIEIRILDKHKEPKIYLYATDTMRKDKDYNTDGRFDNINLRHVPKGHPFEKYASPGKLEEIYNHVMKTGEQR